MAKYQPKFFQMRHGAYSALDVFPDEDENEFARFQEEILAAYPAPDPITRDCVVQLAKLLWRKQRLHHFFEQAINRAHFAKHSEALVPIMEKVVDCETADKSFQTPLGIQNFLSYSYDASRDENTALRELGHSLETLEAQLGVIEKIDRMITQALKRYLLALGIRSMLPSQGQPSSAVTLPSSEQTEPRSSGEDAKSEQPKKNEEPGSGIRASKEGSITHRGPVARYRPMHREDKSRRQKRAR